MRRYAGPRLEFRRFADGRRVVLSPVLVIGFNRPQRLVGVLDRIRESGPPRVYVAIDGPRFREESEAVSQCLDIARSIDWAPVQVRERTRNLGCRNAVIDAVTWLFEQEHEGIIVEDDSVPSASFFPFCDELLHRYRETSSVLAITGESRVPEALTQPSLSYRFSYMGPAGAWATWADRWHDFIGRRTDRSLKATFRTLSGLSLIHI